MALTLCPKCSAEVSDLAPTCPSCHSSLKPAAKASTLPSGVVRCPKCQAEVSSLAAACPACGGPLPSSPYAGPPPKRTGLLETTLDLMLDPRRTFEDIRRLPEGAPVLTLLILTGVLAFIDSSLKDHRFFFNLIMIPVGMILGLVSIWILARLYYHIGEFLGGTGSWDDFFEMTAWVLAVGIPVTLASIISHLFESRLWNGIWGGVGFLFAIWALVVILVLISTAHRFSIGKAIATFLLSILVLLIPMVVVGLLLRIIN